MDLLDEHAFRTLGSEILHGFRDLADNISSAVAQQKISAAWVSPNDTRPLEENFKLFTIHSGIFNEGHASLDYRLRDNREFADFASKLLLSLKGDIHEGMLEVPTSVY